MANNKYCQVEAIRFSPDDALFKGAVCQGFLK